MRSWKSLIPDQKFLVFARKDIVRNHSYVTDKRSGSVECGSNAQVTMQPNEPMLYWFLSARHKASVRAVFPDPTGLEYHNNSTALSNVMGEAIS